MAKTVFNSKNYDGQTAAIKDEVSIVFNIAKEIGDEIVSPEKFNNLFGMKVLYTDAEYQEIKGKVKYAPTEEWSELRKLKCSDGIEYGFVFTNYEGSEAWKNISQHLEQKFGLIVRRGQVTFDKEE